MQGFGQYRRIEIERMLDIGEFLVWRVILLITATYV